MLIFLYSIYMQPVKADWPINEIIQRKKKEKNNFVIKQFLL